MPGEGWSAGTYYLRNLFYALKSLPVEIQPEILLLVNKNSIAASYDELVPFVDKVIVDTSGIRPESFFAGLMIYFDRVTEVLFKPENRLSALLRGHGVDILFSTGAPPECFRLPFFSWIPDFQHLHYPEFFSEREIKWRDLSFQGSAQRGTRIILSSKNSFDDFSRFAPYAVGKARILSFVAQMSEDVYQKEPDFICRKYNIPKRFILLPNQFWKHKNHQTVIRALKIALREEPELTIVCTGNTNEHRDLTYFSRLLGSISISGVREKMIVLGLVPREDLIFLMRQSVAILQPSLFEGWNTTIEEGKSLGKRLILSDIPVHREQDAPYALYFPPTDEHSLALLLCDIFTNSCPGPDHNLEETAKKTLPSRIKKYGETFLLIAQELLDSKNITSKWNKSHLRIIL
jgi:glycosyltransferase involved in cell wall biosynthesis